MTLQQLILRLGLALAFGAIVGIDRQMRRKPAGLRTMMLVSLGSATFALVGLNGMDLRGNTMDTGDVSRVIQGIVGGIGFLGAGVVMHSGMRVAGITTAAAVWVTAAVGVAFGMGEFTLGAVAGIGAILTLSAAAVVETLVFKDRSGEGPGVEFERNHPEA